MRRKDDVVGSYVFGCLAVACPLFLRQEGEFCEIFREPVFTRVSFILSSRFCFSYLAVVVFMITGDYKIRR